MTIHQVTAAELERQIGELEQQLGTARTRAVNAARLGDIDAEGEAIAAVEQLQGRLVARRTALDQARVDEAAVAVKARDAAIDHVASTMLPRLQADVDTAVIVARRERTAAAVQQLDLACRRVSALRSRLLELTNDQRKFHPSQAPNPARLLGDDAALESLWHRVRARGPIDTTDLYAALPQA